ncbi:DUF2946 domain-containing protein [Marinomonas sp. FW-1]|uniref:DUF2946 domain-containing protein n=1 Tax=Marinomonas TaxID=28253 RepID=UPI0034A0BDA8
MCASLLAVFLIYFGPLFSQISNALSPQPTTIQMSMESMAMSGHNHAKMLSEQASNTQVSSAHISHHGHHGHGESANLLEACGYCSLLFHLNWIDAKNVELIPLEHIRYPHITTKTLSHKHHLTFPSLLPRAPPALMS